MKQKKLSFYELNTRYFKDYSGDGIGDLTGLANKFDYFQYIGIDAIILQDVLSVDSLQDEEKSFVKVASEIGGINHLQRVIALAEKVNIKIIIELPIGHISEDHNWFHMVEDNTNDNFKGVVQLYNQKINEELEYEFSEKTNQYYVKESDTQEVPLNWNSEKVISNFVSVIHFWKNLGVSGFIFKDFEYIGDLFKKDLMNTRTLKELRKFYVAIQEIDDNLIIIGKTSRIPLNKCNDYVYGSTKVFDYIFSDKFNEIGIHHKYKKDVIGKFSTYKLAFALSKYANQSANIVSFDSKHLGKVISRWMNDGQYIDESAKTLIMLQGINKSSFSLYSGSEIGLPNIGLTHLDNFQDESLEKRKGLMKSKNVAEKSFMEAQALQGSINARALMPWDNIQYGGFTTSPNSITPVSSRYKEINVKLQFQVKKSVLNFTKKFINFVKQDHISEIIDKGKYSVISLIPGVIKVSIKYNKSQIILFANLSDKSRFFSFGKNSNVKIILSSYEDKEYQQLPKILEPYESIIVLKNADKFIKHKSDIASTQKVFIKENSEEKERLRHLSEKQKINDLKIEKQEYDNSHVFKENTKKEIKSFNEQKTFNNDPEFEKNSEHINPLKQVEEILESHFEDDVTIDPSIENKFNSISKEAMHNLDEKAKSIEAEQESMHDINHTEFTKPTNENSSDNKEKSNSFSEIVNEVLSNTTTISNDINLEKESEANHNTQNFDADSERKDFLRRIAKAESIDSERENHDYDELAKLKEEQRILRETDRSYLDEKTRLTEDQLAKTTLINDDIDPMHLFDDD